jgi:hypothetical protein
MKAVHEDRVEEAEEACLVVTVAIDRFSTGPKTCCAMAVISCQFQVNSLIHSAIAPLIDLTGTQAKCLTQELPQLCSLA